MSAGPFATVIALIHRFPIRFIIPPIIMALRNKMTGLGSLKRDPACFVGCLLGG